MKFRVFWNGTIYYPTEYDTQFYIDQESNVWLDTEDTWYPTLSEVEDATVMFWTGLKDKEGTDIYDGDILASTEDGNNKHSVVYNHEEGEWDTNSVWNTECRKFKTVIGNIHQNPELLESKNE